MKSSSKINGTIHFLWRAVDQHGNVLDVLVQSRRHAVAAIKFVRPLLTARRYVPRVLVTDKLASDGPAHRLLMPAVEHRQSKYQKQSGRERASASSASSMRGNRPHTPGHCGIAANLNGFGRICTPNRVWRAREAESIGKRSGIDRERRLQ